jgi:hypothetical protein
MARSILPRGRLAVVPAQSDLDDPRAAAVLAVDEAEDELRARVREALDKAGCGYSEATLGQVVGDLRATEGAVESAKLQLVEAGRRLLRVQAHVGPGGYKALRARGLVPVDEAMAAKLRSIARAINEGRVPEARLPRTLKVAYLAVTLPTSTVTRLLDDGTLHAEISFRRLREAAAALGGQLPPPASGLTTMRRRLLCRRLARYEDKVRGLRLQLGLPLPQPPG